ncbi:HEAT repeat-containing protein 1 [Caerostris darwini]|uniref:HEAT repeat-containing protein 1 n=1 Tax=Caerostris darwini TaxID=1538125 RepID=A0AAV4PJV2_9ARAC|nr:HEAT repeat-containing protein 1 [Caerostris darwini]
MKFLSDLPDNKKTALNASSEKNLTEPFNVATHSDEQLQMYKCNILSYTNIWLSSPAFISQVAELDTKALHNLEKKYEILLESTLHYLQHLRNSKSVDTNEKNTRFNLFPLLFELVGHVNSLLPCSLFIRVVHHLLCNPEVVIQTKAIELLSSKLEQQQELFQDEDHASLKQLLRPLLKVLRKFDSESSEEYSLLNRQTALYALHLLTKVIGSKYPTKFLKVLKVTIEILKHNDNEALTINALLCLAQLCSSLNVEVLPWLNTFMPIIVRFLADYKTLVLNDSLILGIVTTLFSLIKNLDKFLSSYMPSIITGICVLSAQYLEVNKSILFEKLSAFQNLLSSGVDLRILLKSIEESYSQIIAIDHKAVIPLMNILKEKINTCSYTDISACASFIEQYFLVLLDFRNTTDLQDPVSPVELSIISALETFVMKLPVTLFSSFFLKIYQWATATETKIKLRLFTFYGLTRQLSKSLKNLFVVIAKTFLKHSALELDSNNSNKSKDIDFSNNHNMLSHHLINILDTLNTCFLYDNRQLIDKDNFEFLMQPLVDQLENLSDDETSYQERVSNYLSSCIARFMAGISDNTLWKKLNKLILLKTRHDYPIVRFAALQVIREVVKVMGDDYLVLLPESIPFLAEILEDESAEVEQECKSVVKEMEKILGEPISTYFR